MIFDARAIYGFLRDFGSEHLGESTVGRGLSFELGDRYGRKKKRHPSNLIPGPCGKEKTKKSCIGSPPDVIEPCVSTL